MGLSGDELKLDDISFDTPINTEEFKYSDIEEQINRSVVRSVEIDTADVLEYPCYIVDISKVECITESSLRALGMLLNTKDRKIKYRGEVNDYDREKIEQLMKSAYSTDEKVNVYLKSKMAMQLIGKASKECIEANIVYMVSNIFNGARVLYGESKESKLRVKKEQDVKSIRLKL